MRIGYQLLLLALLGVLLLAAIDLRGELRDLRAAVRNAETPEERFDLPGRGQVADAASGECVADGPALRRLIREELRDFDARWTASHDAGDRSSRTRGAANGAPAAQPWNDSQTLSSPERTAELDLQFELVHQEIDLYLDHGEISNAEMAVLQGEIARLSPSQRIEAMRRLVAAINSGELDGRL
ncbi:hypothetical protein [Halomonas denitrificans]|nr:hypothetical protein [Halomonas denitrificans]